MNRQTRIALTVVASALLTTGARAAAIIVTSNSDDAAGACTLRDAVTAANNDSPVNGCSGGNGADAILFQLSAPGPIQITSPLPLITTSITMDGAGQGIEISGNGSSELRILEVAATGALDLRGITVTNGSARDDGGGLSNFGQATITDCTFRNNFASFRGGAIYNRGVLTIIRSTFVGNRVEGGGGAVWNTLPGIATIANSTLSGNRASDELGTAITNASTMTLLQSTIVENHGNTISGGNSAIFSPGSLTMANTVVARNTPTDCWPVPERPITAAGPNLIGDGSCSVAGAYSGDPKIGSLAANGGPTLTHALLEGSIAIDTGSDAVCATPLVGRKDQRGFNRPSGLHCDLGAVESLQFTGFLRPVRNPPEGNVVKAGQAVPVKFSLASDQGLQIFAPGYPKSQPAGCVSGTPLGEVADTVSAGGSTLSYDSATDTYTYVWKTDKSWRGCRQLTVQLADGTVHTANFELR